MDCSSGDYAFDRAPVIPHGLNSWRSSPRSLSSSPGTQGLNTNQEQPCEPMSPPSVRSCYRRPSVPGAGEWPSQSWRPHACCSSSRWLLPALSLPHTFTRMPPPVSPVGAPTPSALTRATATLPSDSQSGAVCRPRAQRGAAWLRGISAGVQRSSARSFRSANWLRPRSCRSKPAPQPQRLCHASCRERVRMAAGAPVPIT